MNEQTKDGLLIALCIICGILLAILIVLLIIFCRKKVSHMIDAQKKHLHDTDLRCQEMSHVLDKT